MPDQAVILLADDSDNDARLIRTAFEKTGFGNPFQVVKSGEEAIAYLQGEGRYANRAEFPLPRLFLLDLKMQGASGFDVLRWLRQQPSLQTLPVLILTGSDDPRDVNEAYELGANSFIVKPVDFEQYIAMTACLKDYWLRWCQTPETSRPGTKSSTPSQKSIITLTSLHAPWCRPE